VATPRLFKLKAEVAPAASGPRALVLPVARVRVDTGVFHLDQLYDYAIPEKLSAQIQIGVRVQLPFGGRETEGIVQERVAQAERAGELKPISKVLSPHPIATIESLTLFEVLAQKYACNPWDIIRSAIPPRVASVDKLFTSIQFGKSKPGKTETTFETFHPFTQPHRQLNALVSENFDAGSVLIIAPDEKDVDQIIESLSESGFSPLKLTAAMQRDQRYSNFLTAINSYKSIVVGTRSAVFAPVTNLATIIIFKESSFDHYEVRSPGWNSRAVAQLRASQEKLKLVLTGFSPSIEVGFEIENRHIKYITSRESIEVKAFTPTDGALLPGRIFSEIRAALKLGPVLFLAPRKGYGNALLCAHCRNIALCECGGRLSVGSKTANPICVHCGKNFDSWKCSFCHRDKQYLAGRGIERASEEISRAFAGFPVIISAGDVIKGKIENRPSLVLATPGAQPDVAGGYAAVVVLDGMRFFAHTDLRTAERARELFLETSALISRKGKVLLVLEESHPISASIARWNVAPLLKRELAERSELQLPPYTTSAVLVMGQSDATQIFSGLSKAIEQGRLPQSTRLFGPAPIAKGQAKIVLHVENTEAPALIGVVHELQRRRSIAKKELFTLRINPYSL
jgi:primosomal protein N' (replication factor Y)